MTEDEYHEQCELDNTEELHQQQQLEEIYIEGYSAYYNGTEEHNNPYEGIEAEWLSDGWSDSLADVLGG